jgi:hypothetical protein
MRHYIFTILIALLLLPAGVRAQPMTGVITDAKTGEPCPNVIFENIHTKQGGTTDSNGKFSIAAEKGQLIEFHRLGYKTARIRVPAGAMPPFFKIQIEEGAQELREVQVFDRYRNYRNDSLRNYELYKNAINYQKLSGYQVIQHPFTAMSKHYRRIMSFQKEYNFLEQMRYVDYAFNEKTITNLTGLKGDSLQRYMHRFRPSYDQLRAMPEYYFYSYIKETAETWRRQQRNWSNGGRVGH